MIFCMSLIYMEKRVGDRTLPWGTPSLRVWHRLLWSCIFTLALLSLRYSVIHWCIFPITPYFCSLYDNPFFQTLSNAFSISTQTATVFFFSWKPSSMLWEMSVIWSSVHFPFLKPACSSISMFLFSECKSAVYWPSFPWFCRNSLAGWLVSSYLLFLCFCPVCK